MKGKLSDIDWQELFEGRDVNLSWEKILKLLNEIILKYTPRFNISNWCKKSVWMSGQAFSRV